MLTDQPNKPDQDDTTPLVAGAPAAPVRWRHRLFGRPRLSTLLLAVNLILLMAPLSGIFAMRLYESALIRQTETALQSQAVFVAASYRAALLRNKTATMDYGELSHPVADEFMVDINPEVPWRPRPPKLDLARDPLQLPPDPPRKPDRAPHWLAKDAGSDIWTVLMEAHFVTLSAIRVVDHQGIIVSSTKTNEGLSLGHLPEVQRALRGESVSILRQKEEMEERNRRFNAFERASGIRVYVAAPIMIENQVVGAVLVFKTPATLREALRGKTRVLFLALAFLIFVAAFVSLFMGATISGPVSRLVRQSKQVVQGRRSGIEPLEHPVTAEIAELSETVSSMADVLLARAEYISDFAAKVSHEFKTPLTSIQGAVELLRDHASTMDDASRERFLANIADDSDRLSRLVTRLLELARADVMQPEPEGVSSDILGFLRALSDVYEDRGSSFDSTQLEQFSGDLRVAVDADTLASIVRNLIDNALLHGKSKPRVEVQAGPAYAVLLVSDDGPGISTANAGRIFDPFFTTDREGGGTGLGLSLVKSLVEAHGGSIKLTNHVDGCQFVVTLPRATDFAKV
ncbi:ATP-binding protein [Alphaproteobacteria bacterium]|nr:ATP-binding protein [Alphaproteobacteria bacterium]